MTMGGWGTVSKVLETAEDFTAPETPPDLPEDLDTRLADLGVTSDSTYSFESKARCLTILSNDEFWRAHCETHGCYKRVKNWLWVHDKYRDYLKELVALAKDGESADDARYPRAMKNLTKKFDKLNRKILQHSQFEDQQLFKYFLDRGDAACRNSLSQLMEEHNDKSKEEAVMAVLTEGVEKRGDLMRVVEEYRDWMIAHMDKEEKGLLRPWLSLSPSQYQEYRSYLSWKYSIMY